MPFAGNLHLPAAHFCLWGKVYATQQKLHNQKFTQMDFNCLPPSGQAQAFSIEFSSLKIPDCHAGLEINKKLTPCLWFPSKSHLTLEDRGDPAQTVAWQDSCSGPSHQLHPTLFFGRTALLESSSGCSLCQSLQCTCCSSAWKEKAEARDHYWF